jgi:cell division protein FtsZ
VPEDEGGFDPNRLTSHRPSSIVEELLSPQNASRAHGFTEIRVIGVGGAGCNTVNRMIDANVTGIEFAAVNTDAQALTASRVMKQVCMGRKVTGGLGAGGNVRLGLQAAEHETEALEELVAGSDMVFVTAGLGGGTGTGAAPYVAQLAQSARALTVGIVSRPFAFEGRRKQEIAADGLTQLKQHVDALIVVSNDRLMQQASSKVNLASAFQLADEVLHEGITGVANLIITPGLINLDFADVSAIMANSGSALMAMGIGQGEHRARDAALSALNSPLLESPITGAKGLLLNITGGDNLTLHEVSRLAETMSESAAPDVNIILGASVNPRLRDEIRVTVIATGLQG